MTKRMLLDCSHPEETRVVVLSGNRLEEFDYETRAKRPLKGNIYLAKVTRVEPSLQAAFVEYGGNRHGFLPFSEIHPDYYRLPVADREALVAEEQAAQRREDDGESEGEGANGGDSGEPDAEAEAAARGAKRRSEGDGEAEPGDAEVEQVETTTSVETLAGDDIEDAARRRAAFFGRYKIQEVIKRRQVILVQVVKEERGNKGAALTTYLSLAGRYCVLMPNTNKGGGISRKIASAQDRRRLKQVLSELNIPEGMAIIVRTAGSNRTKAEIKRDYEYLLRLWDQIRETTLRSTAPSLIHEEANLVKRAIRDLYTRDMEQVLVEGEDGYKLAKTFMRSLMPSHAKKVQKYEDAKVPLFHRHEVEAQLDNIHNPTVQLRSGGYIVMNQTEALVAIDVNSGKATKERHIEETALKTNLEAADEVARQLKLRDLAGLIVIDFIDMDAARNNREVEQRLKEAMRQDRARIQLGRISPFGLLELSRQRLRPSLHETSTEVCRSCGGSGFVRSPESTALHVLRALEEEGIRRGGGEMMLTLPTGIALYTLNQKRERLFEIERRYTFRVNVATDDTLVPPAYRLDRLSTVTAEAPAPEDVDEVEVTPEAEVAETAEAEWTTDEAERKPPKRGKRGGRRQRKATAAETAEPAESAEPAADAADQAAEAAEAEGDGEPGRDDETDEQKAKRRRRRGKRGGRRRAKRREEGDAEAGREDEAASADAGQENEAVSADAGLVDAVPAASGQDEATERAGEPAERGAEAAPCKVAEAGAVAAAGGVNGEAEPTGDATASGAVTGTAGADDAAMPPAAGEAEDTPAGAGGEGESTVATAAASDAAESGRDEAGGKAVGKATKAPRKRQPRRRKAAAEAPSAEASTGAASAQEPAGSGPAPAAENETPAAESEAPAGEAASEDTQAAEAKPKAKRGGRRKATTSSTSDKTAKRTRRSPRKKPAADAPAQEPAETPSAAPDAEAAATAAAEPVEHAAASPAESTGEETAQEGPVVPAQPPRAAPGSSYTEAPFGEAAESQGVETPSESEREQERPKRRGWWQKLVN